MLTSGFNHNIPFGDKIYHVQTELSEVGQPHVTTQVFLDGRIVASHRGDCGESDLAPQRLLQILKKQQKNMIRKLLSGQLLAVFDGHRRAESDRQTEMPWKTWRRGVEGAQGTGACSESDLSVRRSVVRLRHAVVLEAPPESREDLDTRLRHITTALAVLVCKNHGELLREEELAELLMLRSETIAWITEGAVFGQGLVIWEAFDELSGKLMRINDRESIVRHDYQALAEVARRLFEPEESPERMDDETYDLLRSVSGRDEEFDRLLERPAQVRLARAWQVPLRRLLTELGVQLEGLRGNVPERRDQ